MGLFIEIGTVTFPASGTTGNETVNLTKFSAGQPLKAVLFLGTNNVTMNSVAGASGWSLVGMTDGTNQGCAYAITDNNETITITSRVHTNNYCIEVVSPDQVSTGRAAISSFTATSFELTYSGVTSNSVPFFYVAIGGSDITDAAVLFWDEPETDETNPASIAVGFQPDCIITTGVGGSTYPTIFAHARNHFGVCVGPNAADQCSYLWESADNAASSDVASRLNDTGAVGRALATGYSGVMMTPESNGFQIDVTESAATSTQSVQYCSLCLKGGKYRLLKPQSPTVTGTQDNQTGLSSISGVISFTSGGNTGHSGTIGRWNVGISDGTTKYSMGRDDLDNRAISDSFAWKYNDRLIQVYTTVSDSILTADVDFIGQNVQLDWTDVDASARDMFILVIGAEETGSLFMGMNC
jgi:hypothetical protein